MATRPFRILALPGYAQNKAYFEAKLKPVKEIWGEEFEIVVMEPPLQLAMPTLVDSSQTNTEPGEAPLAAGVTQNARYWWPWSSHRKYQPGELEIVLRYLRDFLEKNGSFDACMGFSQGAATCVLLTALLEHPELHPIFAAPPTDPTVSWPPPPLKCAILFSAFGPGDPKYQTWFVDKPTTPTLHLIGQNDVVVNHQYSIDTSNRFANAKVVWHLGGHHVPRKPHYAHLARDFFLQSCDEAVWREEEQRDGWGSPTESVADSIGEGNSWFPVTPIKLRSTLQQAAATPEVPAEEADEMPASPSSAELKWYPPSPFPSFAPPF
ncbi:hypothetical protein JCM10207_006781 [Rhodosporidiobolus poonsookiae]